MGLQIMYQSLALQQLLHVLHTTDTGLGRIHKTPVGMHQREQQEHAGYTGISLYWGMTAC